MRHRHLFSQCCLWHRIRPSIVLTPQKPANYYSLINDSTPPALPTRPIATSTQYRETASTELRIAIVEHFSFLFFWLNTPINCVSLNVPPFLPHSTVFGGPSVSVASTKNIHYKHTHTNWNEILFDDNVIISPVWA